MLNSLKIFWYQQKLKSKNVNERVKAIEQLNLIDDLRVTNIIVNQCNDSDPEVRVAVLTELKSRLDSKSLTLVLKALSDEAQIVQTFANEMLNTVEISQLNKSIISIFQTGSVKEKLAIVEFLSGYNYQRKLELKNVNERSVANNQHNLIDESSFIDIIVNIFNDSDPEVRVAVLRTFMSRLNSKSYIIVLKALADDVHIVQNLANEILNTIEISQLNSSINTIFQTGTSEENLAILKFLSSYKNEWSIKLLFEALENNAENVRVEARNYVKTLICKLDITTNSILVSIETGLLNNLVKACIANPMSEECNAVIQWLSNWKHSKATELLIKNLGNNLPSIRKKIVIALANHSEPGIVTALLRAWIAGSKNDGEYYQCIVDSMLKLDRKMVLVELEQILNVEESDLMIAAIKILVNLEDDQVFNLLVRQLQHKNSSVRLDIIKGFGMTKKLKSINYLMDAAMHDKDLIVQRAALTSLADINNHASISAFIEALTDYHESLSSIQYIIKQLDINVFLSVLNEFLTKRKSIATSKTAIYCLALLRTIESVGILIDAMHDNDPEISSLAVKFLMQISIVATGTKMGNIAESVLEKQSPGVLYDFVIEKHLKSNSEIEIERGINWLIAKNNNKSIVILIQIIQGVSRPLKCKIIKYFGKAKVSNVVELLANELGDYWIGKEAKNALMNLNQLEVIEILSEWISCNQQLKQLNAIRYFDENINLEAIPIFIAAMKSNDIVVRYEAADILNKNNILLYKLSQNEKQLFDSVIKEKLTRDIANRLQRSSSPYSSGSSDKSVINF